MNCSSRTSRAVRSLLIGAAVCATTAAGAVPAGGATRPPLTLQAAQANVTVLYREAGGDHFMFGSLGIFAVADLKQAFEVRATRKDYGSPIVARLIRKGRDQTLPVPADFSGLPDFSQTTFRTTTGEVVATSMSSFCPNADEPLRRSPDAPASSPYPRNCVTHPYSLGAVWGVQSGYAVRLRTGKNVWGGELPDLMPGSYVATTSITPAYRAALHLPESKATVTVNVTVNTVSDDECGNPADCRKQARTPTSNARTAAATTAAAPRTLSGSLSKPKEPLPDLRSLPAWGVRMDSGHHLDFWATVWNAGPGRLVVDGFRSVTHPDVMDAYQYFFSASGKQKGFAPVGGMEWDARDGHEHWHFKDFAHFRLVAADRKTPVLDSGKEAFCVASDHAVDLTIRGAVWQPENTDLHSWCGDVHAVGLRDVLETGWGDSSAQEVPGQSFDLDGVANGTYYIEVTANPAGTLYERRTSNNTSLRKVVLGGSGHHRTVAVEKVGGVVEPPVGYGEGQ